MLIEFLCSLIITKILVVGMISIAYLAYLKVILGFILKQALICSMAIGVSSYQCKKRAINNISNFTFLSHEPILKIRNQSGEISGEVRILKPTLLIKNRIHKK